MNSNPSNHQVRLAARPTGMPGPECWRFTEEPVPEPREGEFVVRIAYLSLDPAMRGWMNEAKSYIRPVGIGEVMRAGAVGRVIASRHSAFREGDAVSGAFGVQEYAVSDGKAVHVVDPRVAPLPRYLGVLGMAGELRGDGIAVNSIWPRTVISTAAVQNLLGGDATMRGARTPEIMADAAYAILTKPSREFTGNFCVDEEILKKEGVTDFSKYQAVPGADLIPDFFV